MTTCRSCHDHLISSRVGGHLLKRRVKISILRYDWRISGLRSAAVIYFDPETLDLILESVAAHSQAFCSLRNVSAGFIQIFDDGQSLTLLHSFLVRQVGVNQEFVSDYGRCGRRRAYPGSERGQGVLPSDHLAVRGERRQPMRPTLHFAHVTRPVVTEQQGPSLIAQSQPLDASLL